MDHIIDTRHGYCLITSVAMVLDRDIHWIMTKLGHIGYKNDKFVGFHTQELIDFALENGFAVTKIQAFPIGQFGDITNEPFTPEQATARMAHHMRQTDGVILGIGKLGTPHASAWDHTTQSVYDPCGATFPASEMPHLGFEKIEAFLRFDRLDKADSDIEPWTPPAQPTCGLCGAVAVKNGPMIRCLGCGNEVPA